MEPLLGENVMNYGSMGGDVSQRISLGLDKPKIADDLTETVSPLMTPLK
jgi:hypothetical protein